MDNGKGLSPQLPAGMDREALRALADLPETRRLGERFDAAGAAEALSRGDEAALAGLVRSLLATPEGKALAEKLAAQGGQP